MLWGSGLRDGFAEGAPAGEVPGVGEAFALVGFYGLDRAIYSVEEDACAGGRVGEGEAVAVWAETGVALDEIPFAYF